MTATAPRKLFVNLPVRDLARSIDFFTKLGFAFDARFTDQNAACMIVSDEVFVMLLVEDFFRGFVRRPVVDPAKGTAALYALELESRSAVDAFVRRALEAGGSRAADVQDHGFMYGSSFYDLDGHHWEVFWMDSARLAQ